MKQPRAKQYQIRISPARQLLVSLRRFKTSKNNRAKSFKQLVLPMYGFGIKEISIRQQKKKRRRIKREPAFAFIRKSTAIPLVMVLIGLSGTLYFGLKVNSAPKVDPPKTFSPVAPAESTKKPTEPAGLPRSEPTRITIPSVGIDYGVMTVGKQADGTMEVPPLNQAITGWYKHGPTPGEIGPAIIVGHVDTKEGPSVFWRLREVQPGAIIETTRTDGKTIKFKVTALKQFEQDNFPTQEVYGNISHAGLRVITCGGVFNESTGRYTQNTVVFADIAA